jgi:uncharacterized protein with PIN domain
MEDQSLSVKFVVDGMLGTLATWLRIAGYDTLFDHSLDDHQLVRLARSEGRILLTRDRELARRRGVRSLLVSSDSLDEQLLQVLAEFTLTPDRPFASLEGRPFSRCPVCNEPLRPLDPLAARAKVPPYVAQTQRQFSLCPICQRVYWRGTHWQRMKEHLAQLLSQM